MPTTEHTWRSEDNLQAWVLSLYHVGPRVESRWAGMVPLPCEPSLFPILVKSGLCLVSLEAGSQYVVQVVLNQQS